MARTAAAQLRSLIDSPGMIEGAGAYDVVTMRAVEHLGFQIGYVAGSVTAATVHGLPDIGLIEPGELIRHAGRLARAVHFPVIADLDDGGGNPLRIRRTVELAESAGLAGFHIEDFDYSLAKHLLDPNGKIDLSHGRLHSIERTVAHIEAAVAARRNPDTVVIIRTDAALLETVQDVLERSNAYAQAGADMVFAYGVRPDDILRVLDGVQVPMMLSIGVAGASAGLDSTANRVSWETHGLKLLLNPVLPALAAFHGAWTALRAIREAGNVAGLAQEAGASLDQFLSKLTNAEAWTNRAAFESGRTKENWGK